MVREVNQSGGPCQAGCIPDHRPSARGRENPRRVALLVVDEDPLRPVDPIQMREDGGARLVAGHRDGASMELGRRPLEHRGPVSEASAETHGLGHGAAESTPRGPPRGGVARRGPYITRGWSSYLAGIPCFGACATPHAAP